MASEAQIAANRRNAQRSTGPKSKGGKARVGRNAIRHGLRSAHGVVPDEFADEFAALREVMRSALEPADEGEETLVAVIALSAWRLRRVARLEAEWFDERPDVYVMKLGLIARYEATHERVYRCAMRALERHQARRHRAFAAVALRADCIAAPPPAAAA